MSEIQVPMLDLRAQLAPIKREVEKAVLEVIESTSYVLGPAVAHFEREIAEWLGVGHAVAVKSGTDALLLSLMALGVGRGDVVVTSPYSFIATASSIVRLGAEPAFVDIDARTFNMDAAALARWLDESPARARRVKAILPVHLFGQAADLDAILELARQRDLVVVEDAAQAIGATYPWRAGGVRKVGGFGSFGCFSFYPTKNLGALGDGGLVVTDDDDAAARVRRLRDHGARARYHHDEIGGNFRLDSIQAAALSVKLRHLDHWNERRRRNAAAYDDGLRGLAGIAVPYAPGGRQHHVYHQYVITVERGRDELRTHLRELGIATEIYYPVPLHLQRCFASLGYHPGDLPRAEHAAAHTLAVPVFAELGAEQLERVVGAICCYVSRGSRER